MLLCPAWCPLWRSPCAQSKRRTPVVATEPNIIAAVEVLGSSTILGRGQRLRLSARPHVAALQVHANTTSSRARRRNADRSLCNKAVGRGPIARAQCRRLARSKTEESGMLAGARHTNINPARTKRTQAAVLPELCAPPPRATWRALGPSGMAAGRGVGARIRKSAKNGPKSRGRFCARKSGLHGAI